MTRMGRIFRRNYGDVPPSRPIEVRGIEIQPNIRKGISLDEAIRRNQEARKKAEIERQKQEEEKRKLRAERIERIRRGAISFIGSLQEQSSPRRRKTRVAKRRKTGNKRRSSREPSSFSDFS